MKWLTTTALASVLTLSLCPHSGAALIAYEGFDYEPVGGDLSGLNGGSGFAGSWTPGGFNASISNNYDIQNDSLSFGALLTSGRSTRTLAVGAIAGVSRNLADPLGLSNETVYLSFLVQPEGTLHGGAFNGFLGLIFEQGGEPELFVGKPGGGAINQYVLEDRGGSRQHSSGLVTEILETALLVVKAEFAAAGNDKFTLYVNPTPGGAEPASGTIKNDADAGFVTGLTIYSSGAFRLDEIRLGETFADVTPIPEPGTIALLFAVAPVMGWFCRRL